MDRLTTSLRSWFDRLRRRLSSPASRPEGTAAREMLTGALVGMGATAVMGWLKDGDAPMLVFAVLIGAFTGGIIGLLLWLETAKLPDDPVPPPARERHRK